MNAYRSGGHLACRRAGHPARRKWRVVREGACDLTPVAGRQDAALYGSQDGRRHARAPHSKRRAVLKKLLRDQGVEA